MTGAHQRQRRLADLRKRITGPQDAYERCRAYPCGNNTTADRGEGLNRLYCRKHIEFYRRHGSYVKRSYGAGELRPYRRRALAWLKENESDRLVRAAIDGVRCFYVSSGAAIEAFRLSGKTPSERAMATWAQLRKRGADPIQVVAAWLAVYLRLRDDSQPDRHEEYLQVQAAKIMHRMAGGTHKRWGNDIDGIKAAGLHVYPCRSFRLFCGCPTPQSARGTPTRCFFCSRSF